MVRTQHNVLVKEFMTDAGGEYKSIDLQNKFKHLGIISCTSVPHMHQQNGRAERLNLTLMEKAQPMRFVSCLPQNWWEFSVEYAVHVYNRTPVKCLAWRTPFEVLNGKKPDILHLRVFGCGAYVFIPEDIRVNKLAPRAEVMTFIGYTDRTKGYKFMRKPNNIYFTQWRRCLMNICFYIAQTTKVLATHPLGVSTQVRTTFLRKMDGSMMGEHIRQICHADLLVTCRLKVLKDRRVPHNDQSNPLCWKKGCKKLLGLRRKSDRRKKARLVAKGFSQQEGIDFNEIFSPVVRFETVRLMLALSALENWHMEAVDVKTAFQYGKLDEEIYMQQPEGFSLKGNRSTKVLRLHRAIYGLKQAALAWWKELEFSMKRLGFKRTASDAGVFIANRGKNLVIIIVYVDDAIFFGKNIEAIKKVKKFFIAIWECRDLGEAREFLRMKIRREGKKIFLDQTAYLDKVVKRFGMSNARGANTPLPGGYVPQESKEQCTPQERQTYQ